MRSRLITAYVFMNKSKGPDIQYKKTVNKTDLKQKGRTIISDCKENINKS